MHRRHRATPLLACVLSVLTCLAVPAAAAEAPFVRDAERHAEGGRAMISVAHPLAADAGQAMLAQGGSAVDAAIAAQMVLTLVEPQSSGIGGGGFLLHYHADSGTLATFDGRETAPGAANERLFLDDDGEPLGFWDAVIGGRSVGVPGLVPMLHAAHARYGRLDWETLMAPAIRLAREGFEVSPRLHQMLSIDWGLDRFEAAAAYFFTEDGRPLPEGHRLRNPALAETLERIAEDGAEAMMQGPIAEAMVDAVRATGGTLSLDDLKTYEPKRRDALCGPYAGYSVCGMPPPSSGGIAMLQILGILERAALAHPPASEVASAHLLIEASRLAFADRDHYLGDADVVDVPVDALLAARYLDARAREVHPRRSLGQAQPGLGAAAEAAARPDTTSTTHLSVVDAHGNVVSMTTSIEMPFGSRLFVGGFLLNNQLTDFDFVPYDSEGRPRPNRVQPGKRPLSSMSPTIAFDADGAPRLAVGSPGGTRIIGYTAQRVAAVLGEGRPIDAAIRAGNIINRNGPTELEAGTEAEALADGLVARGHTVRVRDLVSGVHGIEILPGGKLRGGADPRREGVVRQVEAPCPEEDAASPADD